MLFRSRSQDPQDEYTEDVTLGELIGRKKKFRFDYVYDFGDDWRHEITLERSMEPDETIHYPRCIGGERACPPEDVGGFPGYFRLLEVLENADDPDHDEMREWAGDWDPEQFDRREADRRIKVAQGHLALC